MLCTFAVLSVCGAQTACTVDPAANAQRLAGQAALTHGTLHAGSFVLTTFSRIGAPGQPVDIYLEGDGRAWRTRTEPASDPTPRHPMGLKLAAQDSAANVVYLARPCQFTAGDPHCSARYWTGERYSAEVVAALDAAIGHYAALLPGSTLNLIGYSGGGALAVLIAAGRADIASIRTVAGNLDTAEVVRLHTVSPMPLSLNPLDEAAAVAAIPQIHFSGERDRVIPPVIAERFANAAGGSCVQTRTIAEMSHAGPWDERWASLLAMLPRCDGFYPAR